MATSRVPFEPFCQLGSAAVAGESHLGSRASLGPIPFGLQGKGYYVVVCSQIYNFLLIVIYMIVVVFAF